MDEKVIDVNYTEISDSSHTQYYSIEQVAQILDVKEFNIVYWCNKFNDILNIQSIGMYQIFDDNDIKNLKTIKNLNFDKKMSVTKVKEYLKEHDRSIIIIKRDVPKAEMPIINILAQVINSQNEKLESITNSHNKILEFNEQLLKNQEAFINLFSQAYKEICADKEDINNLLNTIHTNQKLDLESQLNNEIKLDLLNEKVKKANQSIETQNEFLNDIDLKQESNLKIQKENFDCFANQFNGMIEDQKEWQQKQQEEFNNAIQEFLKTTTRMEKRKKLKENNFWHKIFKRDKNSLK